VEGIFVNDESFKRFLNWTNPAHPAGVEARLLQILLERPVGKDKSRKLITSVWIRALRADKDAFSEFEY
jgi:hypothetical protein